MVCSLSILDLDIREVLSLIRQMPNLLCHVFIDPYMSKIPTSNTLINSPRPKMLPALVSWVAGPSLVGVWSLVPWGFAPHSALPLLGICFLVSFFVLSACLALFWFWLPVSQSGLGHWRVPSSFIIKNSPGPKRFFNPFIL